MSDPKDFSKPYDPAPPADDHKPLWAMTDAEFSHHLRRMKFTGARAAQERATRARLRRANGVKEGSRNRTMEIRVGTPSSGSIPRHFLDAIGSPILTDAQHDHLLRLLANGPAVLTGVTGRARFRALAAELGMPAFLTEHPTVGAARDFMDSIRDDDRVSLTSMGGGGTRIPVMSRAVFDRVKATVGGPVLVVDAGGVTTLHMPATARAEPFVILVDEALETAWAAAALREKEPTVVVRMTPAMEDALEGLPPLPPRLDDGAFSGVPGGPAGGPLPAEVGGRRYWPLFTEEEQRKARSRLDRQWPGVKEWVDALDLGPPSPDPAQRGARHRKK